MQAARAASVASGDGNDSHTAVQSYLNFTINGLRIPGRRPLDPVSTPLERKLAEVDLIDAWAWWLVTQQGVNTETAWSYVTVANAWHDRSYGVGFAGGLSLVRVHKMLHGLQTLSGGPIVRRRRIGVRPRHLQRGISASMQPATNAADANFAALFETALVALARAGELASSRRNRPFNNTYHPSRADVVFEFQPGTGRLVGATLWIVNSKAKGPGRMDKIPKYLPASGTFLAPALALYHLVHVVDPVAPAAASSTPLFRNPRTNAILYVDEVRARLRRCMAAIGRDSSVYGAHSLRIGGATALAWWRAGPAVIQDLGHWRSDAYLRYVRCRRAEADQWTQRIASADTDDFEADCIAIDDFDFDASDLD